MATLRLLHSVLLATCSRAWAATWVDPCDENATRGPLDHAVLDEVLQAHVRDGEIGGITSTLVTYNELRANPSRLRDYLRQLCEVDVHQMSPAEALAVLLNTYNAMMLAMVVHFDPPESVWQIGNQVSSPSVWKHPFATLGGVRVSLDGVEHEMIRAGGFAKRANASGRIHAAVNCASLSCPDLQPLAFKPQTLDAQLTAAARQWLANPTKNPGPNDAGTVVVSQIFQWYGQDFQEASGSIHAWLRQYGPNWQIADGATLDYVQYDWSLNEINTTGGFTRSAASKRWQPLAGVVTLGCLLVAASATPRHY